VDEMLECIERRTMRHDDDGTGVNVLQCLTQPIGDPVHDLLVALTVGEWIDEMH
jgi:hypothetical protein